MQLICTLWSRTSSATAFDETTTAAIGGGGCIQRQVRTAWEPPPLVSTITLPLRRSIIPGSTAPAAFMTPTRFVVDHFIPRLRGRVSLKGRWALHGSRAH